MPIVSAHVVRWTLTGAIVMAASFAVPLRAQEPKSVALAQELVKLMRERKLDSIAARHPAAADQYVAALHFPGQLLLVSARYPAPALLNEKLHRSEFRDVYIDLNSAAVPDSKILVTDMGADGLKARREANQPFDSQDMKGKSIRFDGNWREDKMSESDYMKAFAEADAAYGQALEALVAQLKKSS